MTAPSPSLMMTDVLKFCDASTARKWLIPFRTSAAALDDFFDVMLFKLYAIVSPSGVATPISIAILSINIISIDST